MPHDSDGGDFTFNSSTGLWELAGINEVNGTATIGGMNYSLSGMVQLSTYAAEIDSITGVELELAPEPSTWVRTGLGLAVVVLSSRRRRSA